jgi:hypothetical protein
MLDQLFKKYVGNPWMIIFISCGDWGDKSCLDRNGYLIIERAGTRERGRKWGGGEGKGVQCRGFRVLSP